MKTLRVILIVLAAPAALLLGLTQLGSNPIAPGYNTRFDAQVHHSPTRLVLTNGAGDLTCWLKLKIPVSAQGLSAKLSTGKPLGVYTDSVDGAHQWIAIVADGSKREEKFVWSTGSNVILTDSIGTVSNITPTDWLIFMSDKDFDSKGRARWRTRWTYIGGALLALAIVGGALQTLASIDKARSSLTPQQCIEELIESTEGSTPQETKWMRSILTKVLLEGVSPAVALDSIPLDDIRRKGLWFKTTRQFRQRLEWLISELNRYLAYV